MGDYLEAVSSGLEAAQESITGGRTYAYGIWLDDVLIGRVDLVPVNPPRYTIGYLLAESATGHGGVPGGH